MTNMYIEMCISRNIRALINHDLRWSHQLLFCLTAQSSLPEEGPRTGYFGAGVDQKYVSSSCNISMSGRGHVFGEPKPI